MKRQGSVDFYFSGGAKRVRFHSPHASRGLLLAAKARITPLELDAHSALALEGAASWRVCAGATRGYSPKLDGVMRRTHIDIILPSVDVLWASPQSCCPP